MVGPASSATRERREQTRSYSEGVSGRSDTGRGHVCPCGRTHRPTGRRRRSSPVSDHSELTARVYDALVSGKAERLEDSRWEVRYSGDCESPLHMKRNADKGALFVKYLVRCRRCRPCLRAKQFYWARTAMKWTQKTAEEGNRTWFGTLTLTPTSQAIALENARTEWLNSVTRSTGEVPEWWDDVACDERFRLVREELVGWLQRYWKRLRKGAKRCERCYPLKPRKAGEWDHPPASFKYFVVFERHKSGLPHMHWLMHETDEHIMLKALQCAWPHGFTKVKLVRGNDVRKAAFYVSKYLGKSFQARQLASINYAKAE